MTSPTNPARPRARKKKAAPVAPAPTEPAWLDRSGRRAIVNVRRVALGRAVLVGAKAESCPVCHQPGLCVDGKWWHEVDVDTEKPIGDCCVPEMRCPECNGTGRVPA